MLHSNGHQSNQNTNLSGAMLGNSINGTSGGNTNSRIHNRSIPNPAAVASAIKTVVVKYNRRNNPELEKRRIHHCDFLGEYE